LRRSKRTVYEKVWFIKRLLKTVSKKPDEISREDLRCFLKSLEKFSAATYKNALMALKVFFRDFLELPEVFASFKFPHQVFKPKQKSATSKSDSSIAVLRGRKIEHISCSTLRRD
jgi:hypothetical protein